MLCLAASCRALRCLMLAHLLCPAITRSSVLYEPITSWLTSWRSSLPPSWRVISWPQLSLLQISLCWLSWPPPFWRGLSLPGLCRLSWWRPSWCGLLGRGLFVAGAFAVAFLVAAFLVAGFLSSDFFAAGLAVAFFLAELALDFLALGSSATVPGKSMTGWPVLFGQHLQGQVGVQALGGGHQARHGLGCRVNRGIRIDNS